MVDMMEVDTAESSIIKKQPLASASTNSSPLSSPPPIPSSPLVPGTLCISRMPAVLRVQAPVATSSRTHDFAANSPPPSSPPPVTSPPSAAAPAMPEKTKFLQVHTPGGNDLDADYLMARFRLAIRIWTYAPSGVQIARVEFETAAVAARVLEQQGGEGSGSRRPYSLYAELEREDVRWWELKGCKCTDVKTYKRRTKSSLVSSLPIYWGKGFVRKY